MKIRISWLKDYVRITESVDELSNVLMMLGFPIETCVPWGHEDWVLDLEITVNRPDLLSHMGVARELAAYYQRDLEFDWKSPGETLTDISSQLKTISIENSDTCARYVARVVTDVNVKPSPVWLQERLESIGIKPINNIVDITNYVMMSCGQPLHAFDLDLLEGPEIHIRTPREGEEIVLLDGTLKVLSSDILVIADAKQPVAIAGIMGGLHTAVNENTRNVLIESAWFEPRTIRRGRKLLQIQTEASYRFERGTDITQVDRAADHAAYLITQLAGGKATANRWDVYPQVYEPPIIPLRHTRVLDLIGQDIAPNWIEERLKRLGFDIKRQESKGSPRWIVTVPGFRRDVIQETDIIEEIARHYGYNQVTETLPRVSINNVRDYESRELEYSIRDYLMGRGFAEHRSSSLFPQAMVERFGARDVITVSNPLSDERAILRPILSMGLLEAASWNHRRQQFDLRLWEWGHVFQSVPPNHLESIHMAILLSGGNIPEQNWKITPTPINFYDLKGEVSDLLQEFLWGEAEFKPSNHPFLHPYQQADIYLKDQYIGFAGTFHPSLYDSLELKRPVFIAELNMDTLFEIPRTPVVFHAPPDRPIVRRDLSFILPYETPFAHIQNFVRNYSLTALEDWWLLDVYQGEPIPPGYKSYTLRFLFIPANALEASAVDKDMDNLMKDLQVRLKAQPRT